jgi:adenylate kinase
MLEQAKWLVESQPEHSRSIGVVIVLDVPRETLRKRLMVRGRIDDEPEAIEKRLDEYENETSPILNYFKSQNVKIINVDGSGKVGEIHDRIMEELKACDLV